MNFDVKFSETDRSFKPDFGMSINLPGGGAGGKDGASAYEIALENGFEGSEQEWLESLRGEDGKDGYTPIKGVDYFDGADGKDGQNGDDGVSCTHSWNGTVLTIISASGTSSADLKGERGIQGEQGIRGEQGLQGVPGEKGEPGNDGQPGADGYTPVKGKDYWTENDKAEMVNEVIAALPVYDGEVV